MYYFNMVFEIEKTKCKKNEELSSLDESVA